MSERVARTTLEQLVTIEIFGQPYTFKAESEVEQAKAVADFLVREIKKVENELSGQAAQFNKKTVLIIAALNIANEYHTLRKSQTDFFQQVADRSTNLIRILDAALQ